MIFDTHMHCDYSCDSHMKIAEAVAAAKQQNIGIVITYFLLESFIHLRNFVHI